MADPFSCAQAGIRDLQTLARALKTVRDWAGVHFAGSPVGYAMEETRILESCNRVLALAQGLRGGPELSVAAARTRAGRGPVSLGNRHEASALALAGRVISDAVEKIDSMHDLARRGVEWEGRRFTWQDAAEMLAANLPDADALDPLRAELDWEAAHVQHGAATPVEGTAKTQPAKPRGKPTGPARAENGTPALLAFSALADYHGYERTGEDSAKVTQNIGTPISGEALREMTREELADGTAGKPVAAGTITKFFQWTFGQPGGKGDGKYSYNRRCKDAGALADAMLKAERAIEAGTFGKPETPGQARGRNIGAAALDSIEDLALPGARRRTKGALKHTVARYSHNDLDSEPDDDAPDFEMGCNFHDLAAAEDLEEADYLEDDG